MTQNKWSLRKVKGVIQIEIDDETATVHIFAETAEAAKKARQVSSCNISGLYRPLHYGLLKKTLRYQFIFQIFFQDFGILRRLPLGPTKTSWPHYWSKG